VRIKSVGQLLSSAHNKVQLLTLPKLYPTSQMYLNQREVRALPKNLENLKKNSCHSPDVVSFSTSPQISLSSSSLSSRKQAISSSQNLLLHTHKLIWVYLQFSVVSIYLYFLKRCSSSTESKELMVYSTILSVSGLQNVEW
jgi:hypothetical protein